VCMFCERRDIARLPKLMHRDAACRLPSAVCRQTVPRQPTSFRTHMPTPPQTRPDAATAEIEAVTAVLHTYFRGHATASGAEMRKAFMDSAHIEGMRPEGLTSWPVHQYSNTFSGQPAADEDQRVRHIDWLDVVGDAAAAKATLKHGGVTFTDFFVLLKVEGQWKIANKVYHAQRA
jgi:Putative lumazine-binding